MHRPLVLDDKVGDLEELLPQIEFHFVVLLAPLALDVAGDGMDLVLDQVLEAVDCGAVVGGPGEGGRDGGRRGLGGVATAAVVVGGAGSGWAGRRWRCAGGLRQRDEEGVGGGELEGRLGRGLGEEGL